MESFISTFLYVFSALLPIVNPVGAAMFFLTLTPDLNRSDRNDLSLRVAVYCFLMCIACLYIGSFILSFFGISLGVLRVAGGIVLFTAGWASLNGPSLSDIKDLEVRTVSKKDLARKAFYPLTLPLTIGPGAISVSTAIGSSMTKTFSNIMGANVAAFATCLVIWICFKYSDRITKKLGDTGADAITRIFSFILICLGVQIFWAGFSELWISLNSIPK
ncbi:MAG: MarC family protein [Burkholderiaceae bacterium]|nr:MarC family protein [Burkholderiaceae bacterium]